jgi:cob(I)alamin adenosyltransferase
MMSERDEPRRPDRPGLVIVYTGNGKGKTTAALGLAFRALGTGRKVAMIQFIKGKWRTGESKFAQTLPDLTFLVMGEGFTWESEDLSRDKRTAEKAWAVAEGMILAGEHPIVILDEITYAMTYGFLSVEQVTQTLRDRPKHVHVVVTGREAPAAVIDMADLVTEMTPIKHPFERGIRAQQGIDF